MVKSNTIEVIKAVGENNLSLMRRFSRRVSGAGIVRAARNRRYNNRTKSGLKVKNDALRRLTKSAAYERLKKLGKIKDVQFRHR